jgi:succinate dehydrogenase/fumarate reductase cytochrome b subunit
MSHSGGRVLVGLVGLAIVAGGAALVVEGYQLKFMRFFRAVPPQVRKVVVHLGRIGTIGRGAVFMLVGALVVSAAWTFDPEKAGGMDTAFRTLLQQPYGKVLGIVAALALLAFGVYGYAEARWRRV